MRYNPDAVDFHDEVVADAAYLAAGGELHHALAQVGIDLQADADALLDVAVDGDVAHVEGHSADAPTVLAPRGIEPSDADSRAAVGPLELLRQRADLVP